MNQKSTPCESYSEFVERAMSSFCIEDSQEVRWKTANRLISELGGTALNIGVIRLTEDNPMWMLSSMSTEWIEKYISEELYKIDPLISHLRVANIPVALNTQKTDPDWPLNEYLRKAGYLFLYGIPFGGNRKNERKIVTYCTDQSDTEINQGDTLDRIKMLAAILTTQFISGEGTESVEIEHFGRPQLGPREKEALLWLKSGYRNDRIAYEMGIAEVTVRKHFLSLRQKLNAMTREQALAIALHEGLVGS